MCILCTEWEREKITSKEAFRAIGEMLTTSKDKDQIKHLEELSEKIIQKEVPPANIDDQADQDWWNHEYEDE